MELRHELSTTRIRNGCYQKMKIRQEATAA